MNLVNIGTKDTEVYKFLRDSEGRQIIETVTDFLPYFFDRDKDGLYTAYDGTRLKKIIVGEQKDIKGMVNKKTYQSDVKLATRFMLDKVDELTKCPVKYCFIDIEVLAKDFPEPSEAKYPVSCITVWDNFSKEYATFFLSDYSKNILEGEQLLYKDFCDYMNKIKPDVLLAWNMDFDYIYLNNRFRYFGSDISPIKQSRTSPNQGVYYPIGTSIVDYMGLFKKVFMREQSYALNSVSQKYLKDDHWEQDTFGVLDDTIKGKNINDVRRMVQLEEKFNLIEYYDELRRLTKVQWEDLYWNSRIVEMMLFEEAKRVGVVLPNKPKTESNDSTFSGATRDSKENGAFFNIGKFDLTSAYPSMMFNFCLDSQNIKDEPGENAIEVNGVFFEQNEKALLPTIVRKILTLKNQLKKDVKKDPSLQFKYDAIKAVVNSTFGVMGNEYFRLYDNGVASSITYLVRDLLHYTIRRLNEIGIEVIYYDTDSVFVTVNEDISDKLNSYVQDWGKQYGKKKIELGYEYEGYFDKIFFLGKCRYFGYVHGKENPEIKGVEIKRSSSSKFEAEFQRRLLDLALNNPSRDDLNNFIDDELINIRTKPLEVIGFPCKIQNKDYKGTPVFLRAYNNSKELYGFTADKGSLFYYTYVNPVGFDKEGKQINVLAFGREANFKNDLVDWDKVIDRSIDKKAEKVYDALGYDYGSRGNQLLW